MAKPNYAFEKRQKELAKKKKKDEKRLRKATEGAEQADDVAVSPAAEGETVKGTSAP